MQPLPELGQIETQAKITKDLQELESGLHAVHEGAQQGFNVVDETNNQVQEELITLTLHNEELQKNNEELKNCSRRRFSFNISLDSSKDEKYQLKPNINIPKHYFQN